MSTNRWRRLGALLTASIALGLTAFPASAQEEPPADDTTAASVPDDLGVVHSWALIPGDGTLEAGERPNLTYELNPGDETQDVVTLFNYSNVALSFRVYATDAFNDEDGAFELLPRDQEPTDVGTWFDVGLEGVNVPAGTQATFPITLRVPADARPGDHVGAILASSEALGTGPDGDVINLDRRTGTRVYVRVTGPLQPELAVEHLSTSYTPALNPLDGRAEVRYRIVNRGNVRLAGTHRVSVGGPFGLLGTSTDAEEIPELLPGGSVEVMRTIEGVAATALSFTDVELEPRSVAADNDQLEATDRRAFGFAVPVTVIALLLAAGLAWFARRSYVRHRNDSLVMEQHAA